MRDYFTLVEASISILAFFLTAFNYYITLRLKSIENRITRLESFESEAKKDIKLLHTINGKLDMLLRTQR